MNIKLIKILFVLMPILFLKVSALAIDLSDFGDYSSRSMIINKQNNSITQEQKDILISKKLSPTIQCLVSQIKKNNYENVELLLNTGLNPNNSYLAEYPLYIAAKKNNFEIVNLLISKGAKPDLGFNSELYEAIKNKNTDMAQLLINKKANIHYIDSITENTILYMALKNNMLDIAQQLINKGIAPDKKSVLYIKKKKLFYLIENKI